MISEKKETKLREFVNEINDSRFVKIVNRALENWKLYNPEKEWIGVSIIQMPLAENSGNTRYKIIPVKKINNIYYNCCLMGASMIGMNVNYSILIDSIKKTYNINDDEIYGITAGFDQMKMEGEYKSSNFYKWSYHISEIIFS